MRKFLSLVVLGGILGFTGCAEINEGCKCKDHPCGMCAGDKSCCDKCHGDGCVCCPKK